jgi:hypothetical protein
MFGRVDHGPSAMMRRRRVAHATLSEVWMIARKTSYRQARVVGGTSELQLRDVGSIIRLADDLDWSYLGDKPLAWDVRSPRGRPCRLTRRSSASTSGSGGWAGRAIACMR